MAKQPTYRLYNGDLATMHVSNDLEKLIAIGKKHSTIFGRPYLIKDRFGIVVWEKEDD